MGLFSTQTPEIPPPEDSSVKEVFSFYGLCMYNAQILEQELINLTVALIANNETQLSKNDFDKFFNEAGTKTLGQLIYDLRKKVKFQKKLEDELMMAKDNRNFVAHDFFKDHSINFGADKGREIMIEELISYIKRFVNVVSRIEKTTDSLFKKLGITEEIVQKELTKMEEEVKSIDHTS